MAKRSEKDNAGEVQAKQNQSTDDETKEKGDPTQSQNPSADDEAGVKGNPDQSQSPSVDDEAKAKENPGPQAVPRYKITCRNAFSKEIGGVTFVEGVGYTGDGFTASWFSNKEGYEVVKE